MSKPLSPLRFPGGKSRAVKKFIQYLPKDVKTICSPFFGGGSFELYCILNFGIKVFAYDFFEPLVAFWNCLLSDSERLAEIVSEYLPVVTREQFYALQKKFPQIEDPWQKATTTYVLNRTSFSGSIMAGGFSPLDQKGRNGRFNESNVEFVRNFHVPEGMLSVEHLSFEESLMRHPQEFLFLDPPYLVKSRLYGTRGVLHDINHALLAEILRSRGDWMLCYDDCHEVRRLYEGFYVIDESDGLAWQYGMSKSKKSREVLILSHDLVERLELKSRRTVSIGSRQFVQPGIALIG